MGRPRIYTDDERRQRAREADARRASNPARRIAQSRNATRNRRLRMYGVDAAKWHNLIAAQNNTCAICTRDLAALRACLDHDHRTGAVRGVLCFDCNTAIGKLGDNVAGLRRALSYLQRHEEP